MPIQCICSGDARPDGQRLQATIGYGSNAACERELWAAACRRWSTCFARLPHGRRLMLDGANGFRAVRGPGHAGRKDIFAAQESLTRAARGCGRSRPGRSYPARMNNLVADGQTCCRTGGVLPSQALLDDLRLTTSSGPEIP